MLFKLEKRPWRRDVIGTYKSPNPTIGLLAGSAAPLTALQKWYSVVYYQAAARNSEQHWPWGSISPYVVWEAVACLCKMLSPCAEYPFPIVPITTVSVHDMRPEVYSSMPHTVSSKFWSVRGLSTEVGMQSNPMLCLRKVGRKEGMAARAGLRSCGSPQFINNK